MKAQTQSISWKRVTLNVLYEYSFKSVPDDIEYEIAYNNQNKKLQVNNLQFNKRDNIEGLEKIKNVIPLLPYKIA
jgi:DNA transposition AAA+ family ATPase